MTPLLLAFGAFATFCLVGLGLLAAIRADTMSLRIVLTAPVLGSAVTVLPLFVFSHAGVAMDEAALPVILLLAGASALILAFRRPRLPVAVLPVLGLCIVNLLLVGRPAFEFGFDWIANANDDMANYVLSATKLLHEGLLAPLDVDGLASNRDYESALQALHSAGSRPGSDITLASFAAVTGRAPYELFMPFILALNMCMICAAAALAMQASQRWWAAFIAAGLLAVSPLNGFGVLQQLLPQVWGLAIAAALFAWLMSAELHRSRRARLVDLVPISVLTVAFVVVYVELAAALVAIYGLYVISLAARRQVAWGAAWVWGAALAAAVVVLNSYFFREIHYVLNQARSGSSGGDAAPQFGYVLVPSALPGILGLQTLPPSPSAHFLAASILIAIVILAIIVLALPFAARRGIAVSLVLLGWLSLGVLLYARAGDFGLFKLYMWVQPFLAAAAGAWLSRLSRRVPIAVTTILLVALIAFQVRTLNTYVNSSRDPIDLHRASSSELLPAFRHAFATTREPVIAVTEYPTLAKLEAASVGKRPLYFVSQDFFQGFVDAYGGTSEDDAAEAAARYERRDGWRERSFTILAPSSRVKNAFRENTAVSTHLAADRCLVVLPTGSQSVVNRRYLPEGSPDLEVRRCGSGQNLLIFVVSEMGRGFYAFGGNRKAVSSYQTESEIFFPRRTFSGFGRYALFRVLDPSASIRMEVDFTVTLAQDSSNRVPHAAAIGATREPLPVTGRGSAHVFSPPLRPQLVNGQPYVLLDMGVNGRLQRVERSGIEGLYGRGVALDPRYLTSYVRNISLVSDTVYRRLHAPAAIRSFPAALADTNLEYSGIYEDGWISERSYAMLDSGRSRNLVVRADVIPRPGQHLDILVDGRRVFSRDVKRGALDLRVPLPALDSRRRVELRWAGAVPLGPHDRRPATARLKFLGFPPAPAQVNVPADLDRPGLISTGISKDGWASKVATATLRGGPASYLDIRAEVLPSEGQRLVVRVGGRAVLARPTPAGKLDVRVALPALDEPRRVELQWRKTAPLGASDKRRAAARLSFLGLVAPPSTVRVPRSLSDPGLVSSGIGRDGWLAKSSFAELAGGKAAKLVLRAIVPEVEGQRLVVRVGGRTLSSTSAAAGRLDLSLPMPASTSTRRVELRWAKTIALRPPDPRHASARLELLSVAPTRALSRVRPDDLLDPTTDYSGIYKDGWIGKSARVLLADGPAGTLTLRARTGAEGQRLRLAVNGRTVATKPFQQGEIELVTKIPASKRPRTVELRWDKTAPVAANDPRQAAALLRSISILATRTPSTIESFDLTDPGLDYSGIYKDGWLKKDGHVVVAGGPAGTLTLRARTGVEGQRLRLAVNGRTVATKAFRPGAVELQTKLAASKTPRTVELRWDKTAQVAPKDRRQAAALLQSISVLATRTPSTIESFDLTDPSIDYSGIYKDGWLQKDARVLIAGGPAGTLTLRAQTSVEGQRLRLGVNGRRVATKAFEPGEIEVAAKIPASKIPRTVELRWDKTTQIAVQDRRQAAALLQSISVLAARTPSTIRNSDLTVPGLDYSGIYSDGWFQKDARLLLASGPVGTLTLRAQTNVPGQRLRLDVNGRTVATKSLQLGEIKLVTPIPASKTPRTVELRWGKTAAIAPNDLREAAALLRSIAIK